MNTFELKVVAINRIFFNGKCKQVIVSAADGSIGIMAHHEKSVLALVEGSMRIQTENDEWIEAVTGVGHAQIAYNRMSIIVDFAEKPEEIDERRAQEALERAQEAMRQKQSIQEYHMSRANIARAMARLAMKKRNMRDIQ
ncbi:MAG: ATP synthase F1 subunit epsilon [Lachnospiraceae bacterium]|nr:ATP synthase F1 subunit epsilon [Lachnospiraceae bacterium]